MAKLAVHIVRRMDLTRLGGILGNNRPQFLEALRLVFDHCYESWLNMALRTAHVGVR